MDSCVQYMISDVDNFYCLQLLTPCQLISDQYLPQPRVTVLLGLEHVQSHRYELTPTDSCERPSPRSRPQPYTDIHTSHTFLSLLRHIRGNNSTQSFRGILPTANLLLIPTGTQYRGPRTIVSQRLCIAQLDILLGMANLILLTNVSCTITVDVIISD